MNIKHKIGFFVNNKYYSDQYDVLDTVKRVKLNTFVEISCNRGDLTSEFIINYLGLDSRLNYESWIYLGYKTIEGMIKLEYFESKLTDNPVIFDKDQYFKSTLSDDFVQLMPKISKEIFFDHVYLIIKHGHMSDVQTKMTLDALKIDHTVESVDFNPILDATNRKYTNILILTAPVFIRKDFISLTAKVLNTYPNWCMLYLANSHKSPQLCIPTEMYGQLSKSAIAIAINQIQTKKNTLFPNKLLATSNPQGYKQNDMITVSEPLLSVVVYANRTHLQHIQKCIQSILNLRYSKSRFNINVVTTCSDVKEQLKGFKDVHFSENMSKNESEYILELMGNMLVQSTFMIDYLLQNNSNLQIPIYRVHSHKNLITRLKHKRYVILENTESYTNDRVRIKNTQSCAHKNNSISFFVLEMID